MILVIELVQDPHVLAVAEQPVDGGKVFPLGQLLVQTPEHLVRVGSKRFILYMRFGRAIIIHYTRNHINYTHVCTRWIDSVNKTLNV